MGNGENSRRTPSELFRRLDAEHHFTLDAAAAHDNALCDVYCTLDGTFENTGAGFRGLDGCPAEEWGDGLTFDWRGHVVFMNPPYGRGDLAPFIEKAWREVNEGGCRLVVGLIPVRSEQPWFHAYVWDNERRCPKPGVSIEFVEGRIKYDGLETGAPFPSMVVTWRPVDA